MYSYICLTYVCRILQVLSGLPLIFIICTLMYCSTPNYNSTATETAESQIIGTLFKGSRPYSSVVILVFNSKIIGNRLLHNYTPRLSVHSPSLKLPESLEFKRAAQSPYKPLAIPHLLLLRQFATSAPLACDTCLRVIFAAAVFS